MYAMLTRVNPFMNSDDCEVDAMLMVANHHPPHPRPLPPNLPQPVGDVVMKAMAKSPDERYRSMGELADAIRSVL